MQRNAKVLAAIEERSREESSERIASRQERQEFWTGIMNGEKNEMKDRLKASELLGKSEGDFLEKVQHSGPVETVLVVRQKGGHA